MSTSDTLKVELGYQVLKFAVPLFELQHVHARFEQVFEIEGFKFSIECRAAEDRWDPVFDLHMTRPDGSTRWVFEGRDWTNTRDWAKSMQAAGNGHPPTKKAENKIPEHYGSW